MLTPIVLWLATNLIKLTAGGNAPQLGSASGEMIEGFIITILFLVVPATLLFWLLLRLFHKQKAVVGKAKILLAIVATSTIIGALLLFNFTNTPEWFALVTVPIGVFAFVFLSKSEEVE